MKAPADAHAGHGQAPAAAHAGHAVPGMPRAGHGAGAIHGVEHQMLDVPLGGGWRLMGMAQAYPIVTFGAPGEDDSPLNETEAYLTQAAAMVNLESPGSTVVLRTTLNFEGLTQEDGELTFGGWGEGFIDKRHPHTLLHELMLSLNLWDFAGGALSLSAGKGFAPYGTDDPMSRPGSKYPTNHHLSQALERWTVNGVYLNGPWSVEAGVFGGSEPEGPYDLSNIESFGDSWSARLAYRIGGTGTSAPWELSASTASIAETHDGEKERTALYNAAVRHNARFGITSLYALLEGSVSEPEGADEGYFSVLGETMLSAAGHQPYLRLEFATRPEYDREGAPGEEGFFRYDHDEHAHGATRWLIGSLGYAYELTNFPASVRPFGEVQYHRVWEERGGITPEALFGTDRFWSATLGFRLFFGGGPMRMGSYGVLDDMTTMHRPPGATAGGHETAH
jgi:hypothetical protein